MRARRSGPSRASLLARSRRGTIALDEEPSTAVVDRTKELEQQAAEPRAIGWDGASARGMLEESVEPAGRLPRALSAYGVSVSAAPFELP